MKPIISVIKKLTGKQGSLNKAHEQALLVESGLLDNDWYMQQYPEVLRTGQTALDHYLNEGESKGNWPNEYFDPAWYKHHAKGSQKFAGSALAHYILLGWERDRDPSKKFSTSLYLAEYPEVKATQLNPLSHYMLFGRYEQKAAFPRILAKNDKGARIIAEMKTIAESGLFKASWYQHYYANLWRHNQHGDVLYQYVAHNQCYFRKPNPVFDPHFYKTHYKNIVGKENPLLHYIREGEKKGLQAAPNFCSKTYFKRHKDLDVSTVSPLRHFLENGLQDGEEMPEANQHRSNKHRAALNAQLPIDAGLRGMIDFEKKPLAPKSNIYNPKRLNIHWVIPDFAAGGGGHMTIFRMTEYLERQGHKQTLWIYNPTIHQSADEAHDTIVKHFRHFGGKVRILDKRFEKAKGDIIIATDCWTVWPTLSATNFKSRFYFVQDFEPAFHPVGSFSLAAEQTYREDMNCLCASPWLEKLMRENYGRWAKGFWLAADPTVYHPTARKHENKKPRIAFYARHFTARRAVELGMLALEKLARDGVEFEVDFFGANLNFTKAPFAFKDHGVATPKELATIFQKADIGVVFSATNYSLVPQEMMACGLPIVELNGDSTVAIFPQDTVTLADPTPESIAASLETLIKDPTKRGKQAKAGMDWVLSFSWEQAAKTVESAFFDRLEECFIAKAKAPKLTPIISAGGIKASVVIPTLNAGPVLDKVLGAVTTQIAPWPYEVLVIDSGSTDGTLETIAKYPSVRLHQIDKKDFNHGGTRNLGAALTNGDFIAFLTHDAQPVNDRWIYNLVTELERFPDAAGAIGKHVAWPEASAFTKRDLDHHFEMLAKLPLFLSKTTDALLYDEKDVSWRQKLHFYSDNNSCMRRSVWQKLPYRAVKYGEDQVWADDIIAAGYGKAYAPQAVVFHSHDYNETENYERSVTESAFFKHFFGYCLIKNEAAMEKAIEEQNKADENWGKANKVPQSEIEKRKKLNASRFRGYLDGYRADTTDMF